MNIDEIQPQIFSKLLRIRSAFKTVSQASWNVSQMERRYPIETISEDTMVGLIASYKDQFPALKQAIDELEELFNEDEKKE